MFRFLFCLLDQFLRIWFCPICPICLEAIDSRGKCLNCNPVRLIQGKICNRCGISIPEGMDLCGECTLWRGQSIQKVRSLLWLNDESKKLIYLVKYQSRFEWLEEFFEQIKATKFSLETLGHVLVPVPIHRSKFVERGFNQAEMIAEIISSILNLKICRGLKKIRETTSQSLLNRQQRALNLKNVFAWDLALPVPEKIILVDDIYTTGQTLNACAETMIEVGTREVLAWTLFRTPAK